MQGSKVAEEREPHSTEPVSPATMSVKEQASLRRQRRRLALLAGSNLSRSLTDVRSLQEIFSGENPPDPYAPLSSSSSTFSFSSSSSSIPSAAEERRTERAATSSSRSSRSDNSPGKSRLSASSSTVFVRKSIATTTTAPSTNPKTSQASPLNRSSSSSSVLLHQQQQKQEHAEAVKPNTGPPLPYLNNDDQPERHKSEEQRRPGTVRLYDKLSQGSYIMLFSHKQTSSPSQARRGKGVRGTKTKNDEEGKETKTTMREGETVKSGAITPSSKGMVKNGDVSTDAFYKAISAGAVAASGTTIEAREPVSYRQHYQRRLQHESAALSRWTKQPSVQHRRSRSFSELNELVEECNSSNVAIINRSNVNIITEIKKYKSKASGKASKKEGGGSVVKKMMVLRIGNNKEKPSRRHKHKKWDSSGATLISPRKQSVDSSELLDSATPQSSLRPSLDIERRELTFFSISPQSPSSFITLNRETSSQLSSNAQRSQVFGVTLEEADAVASAGKVPLVLSCLTEAILVCGGTTQQGLFRIPGNKTRMDELKYRLNNNQYNLADANPHDVASLLKEWLTSLTDRVIPRLFYHRCLDSITLSPSDCIKIVEELPERNLNALNHIILFLQTKILPPDVQKVTRMDIRSIATAFGPCLLDFPGQDFQTMVRNLDRQIRFTINLLRHMNTTTTLGEASPSKNCLAFISVSPYSSSSHALSASSVSSSSASSYVDNSSSPSSRSDSQDSIVNATVGEGRESEKVDTRNAPSNNKQFWPWQDVSQRQGDIRMKLREQRIKKLVDPDEEGDSLPGGPSTPAVATSTNAEGSTTTLQQEKSD